MVGMVFEGGKLRTIGQSNGRSTENDLMCDEVHTDVWGELLLHQHETVIPMGCINDIFGFRFIHWVGGFVTRILNEYYRIRVGVAYGFTEPVIENTVVI